ncbi:hypothetical protein [Streptomyces olivaceiscleroticus]|uniref:Uncharacterized protein n=1 Tax=Streptomyces olivaceiscleroticus TaxID=68245 RepID=A0ABP3LHW8_9ACTN
MTEEEISCTGKRWWFTRAEARREASKLRRQGQKGIRAYECRYCHLHHIGGRPGYATYQRTDRGNTIPLHQYIQERSA